MTIEARGVPLGEALVYPMNGTHAELASYFRRHLLAKLPSSSIITNVGIDPNLSDVLTFSSGKGGLTPRQETITEMDSTKLLEEMSTGKLKAVEVAEAFGLRASVAHQLTNCLTDYFLDDMLERAKELDAFYAETGQTVGPLHGLPISVKEQINIKGRISSMSFLSLHDKAVPVSDSALIVKILAEAGAVFFCHTNLPQTIMTLECESFWGRTLNPYNTKLTSGGSSGGEGALVAMRGSPMGLGTDIGGSVRIPAAHCGLYGLRPTASRLPASMTYVPGRDSILGTIGPLAHSLRDLGLLMSVALSESAAPWKLDSSLLELPWGSGRKGSWEDKKRKLRVGVMDCDGVVRPTAPTARALSEMVEKLKGRPDEVEVVAFPAWKSREGWEIARQLYFPDGGKRIHQLLDQSTIGEPLLPLTKWLLEESGPALSELDIHALWELNQAREAYKKGYLAHWEAQNIDVLLCPVYPGPAPKHGESKWWAYTSTFNLVDYPSIAFPTGSRVSITEDYVSPAEKAAYCSLSVEDQIVHDNYDVNDYLNAPLSLQLVARRFHDEELLSALALLELINKS